jgi:CAI-1 autoinducer synthase
MTNLPHSHCLPCAPRLPSFIAVRLARFENEMTYADSTARTLVLGPAPGSHDINLKSNDYLDLGRNPEVIAAQVAQIQGTGNEQMMSAVFLNPGNAQWELEQRFAELLNAGATVMFQSGYQANTGLLESIAAAGVPIYMDQMAHASLYQGVVVAGADLRGFRHNDTEHLRRQIHAFGPGIVAIDSVYSTDGSVAPIADLLAVAEELDCALIVDESHALGTHGPQGAGLVVELGLQERVHFRTASLAKAFCGRAGLVACPREMAAYLRFTSYPSIFSSAVLPHELSAFAKTLEIVQRDDWRRARLHRNADRLRSSLAALGYNVSASASQIISLEAGSEASVVRLGSALNARGVYGAPFFAPATPKNRACIRLSVHCGLSDADVDRVVAVCAEIRTEIGMAEWPSTRRQGRRHVAQRGSWRKTVEPVIHRSSVVVPRMRDDHRQEQAA